MISYRPINKMIRVKCAGGIIGLFSKSPLETLKERIQLENLKGWTVVQVIPITYENYLVLMFRILLLLLTLFIYTTANDYFIILERKI